MALVAKICLEERVGSFVIKNTTGTWSQNYPYGFGLPTVVAGVAAGWVTSVIAYITPPGYLTPIQKDLGINFSVPDTEFQIMPWDLGSGVTKIESGEWNVEIVIQGNFKPSENPFTYRASKKAIFTKEVECCVDKMTGNTNNTPFNDVFREEKSRTTAELSVLLERAKKAEDCGNFDSANRIVTYIKLHCRCGC